MVQAKCAICKVPQHELVFRSKDKDGSSYWQNMDGAIHSDKNGAIVGDNYVGDLFTNTNAEPKAVKIDLRFKSHGKVLLCQHCFYIAQKDKEIERQKKRKYSTSLFPI